MSDAPTQSVLAEAKCSRCSDGRIIGDYIRHAHMVTHLCTGCNGLGLRVVQLVNQDALDLTYGRLSRRYQMHAKHLNDADASALASALCAAEISTIAAARHQEKNDG